MGLFQLAGIFSLVSLALPLQGFSVISLSFVPPPPNHFSNCPSPSVVRSEVIWVMITG